MSNLEKNTVKRVVQGLSDLDLATTVQDLGEASAPAAALGVDVGAMVQTLVYSVGNRYVLVLIAGGSTCQEDQLSRAFGLDGSVVRPTGDLVRAVTGFSIGGVSPVGLVAKLPVAIDGNLKKYEKIYVSAGDQACVFESNMDELKKLTGGVVSYAVAK
ncbi:MAG: aminoacyl-tRNA deacylase [Rhodospirillaceae bacterium]|nr:MAG: aminoacyl-tRNA deacylase [Rhodospirillaceae bacterium]